MFTSLALTTLLLLNPSPPTDLGPWNGIVDCESSGIADIENAVSSASGLFQFLDSTWSWVAEDAGRGDLVGTRAKDAPVADQYAMAEHLRTMDGGGISHWVCGYRWNDGTGPFELRWQGPAPTVMVVLVPEPDPELLPDWPASVL